MAKVMFVGGPLDGAVDEQGEAVRIFPDPLDPQNRAIVYTLWSVPVLEYRFDQSLTDKANLKIQRDRGVSSG